MKIEVLVTTMHQKDFSKYSDMNLQTDAVIANQADFCDFKETEINGKKVRLITTDTRGISYNRNIAILYSKGDIIVFADDDQRFVDGYEEIINQAFEKNPKADAIKFYCESTNPKRPLSYKRPDMFKKASKKILMSSGVPCFAVKKEFLFKKNITFNNRLGPGQEIFCGEDTVFFKDMCRFKAKIYLSPQLISYVAQEESTWFTGYNERFFCSIGYIYGCVYGMLAPLAILRRALKTSRNKSNLSKKQMIITMLNGSNKHRKGE